ncbi:MAG TPA: hypothetical protein VGA61_04200, partial [Anaerolineae bacterium]
KSSSQAWQRTNSDNKPDLQKNPQQGIAVEGDRGARTLAVSIQGSFDSFFKGKPSPLQAAAQPQPTAQPGQPQPTAVPPQQQSASTIEASPDTARLVVIGSSEFLDDLVFQISSSMTQDRYLNSLQFMQNAVDWSVQDTDLLTIRSRGTYARVLAPLTDQQQATFQALNYILALLALGGIAIAWVVRRRNEKPLALIPQSGQGAGPGKLASQA